MSSAEGHNSQLFHRSNLNGNYQVSVMNKGWLVPDSGLVKDAWLAW